MALAGMVFLMSICWSDSEARSVLEAQGYHAVEITGYSWLSCDYDEPIRTGFHALGKDGTATTGAVCRGWLGGRPIVRTDVSHVQHAAH